MSNRVVSREAFALELVAEGEALVLEESMEMAGKDAESKDTIGKLALKEALEEMLLVLQRGGVGLMSLGVGGGGLGVEGGGITGLGAGGGGGGGGIMGLGLLELEEVASRVLELEEVVLE